MRSSNKSRSRNKNHNNNRRNNSANVVNRVFDSNGPEGKVRGTPQQIIDKYQGFADDATLSGDRVGAENFLQHSEHYSRMLSEAQREIDARREAHEAQRQQQQNKQQNQKQVADENKAQPDIAGNASEIFPGQADNANLVETPESKPATSKAKTPPKVTKTAKADKPEKAIELSPAPPEAEKPAKASKPEAAAE